MGRLISVIVPVYNEAAGLCSFLEKELIPVLEKVDDSSEIIVVNDGSSDNSAEYARRCAEESEVPIRIVSFARNFGKEVALTAGIRQAKGNAVIMIDADGQHPANEIPKMIEKWRAGAKIVTAVRARNTTKHAIGSKIYYKLMRMFGNRGVVEGEMDFRLLDRVVVDEFNKFTERNRITRGLINWLGFPQEYIKVRTKSRVAGKPSYNARKLMALAVDSMVSSSRTPLVFFGYVGLFIMLLSGVTGLFQLIQEYILKDPMHLEWGGGVAVSLFVAFLVGLVLISQAMTALYISQIHAEAKNRPLYVIDKDNSMGIEDEK